MSDTSSDKEHFEKATPIYNEALKNRGFNETLKFSRQKSLQGVTEEEMLFGSTHYLAVMLKEM